MFFVYVLTFVMVLAVIVFEMTGQVTHCVPVLIAVIIRDGGPICEISRIKNQTVYLRKFK